ncbi:MAG: glycosyltransferase family 4 protein [Candidatus Omnitrophota bacterium]
MGKRAQNIIVSTHDSLYPITGGGALRTLKIAEEFKRRGHEVIIIAPTDGIDNLSGIKVHWLHAPKKQYSQILSTVKFNIRLARKFLQFGRWADIFVIHNTIAAVFMPFLKRIFRCRFVLDITDIHAEYLPIGQRNGYEMIATPFLMWYEYFIIRSADVVITATEAMKKLLISRGVDAAMIAVSYDGVQAEKFSLRKNADAASAVIHLGTIDRQHGVADLVRALPVVLKACPQVRFYFVGGGRELPAVKRLAVELGVSDKCIFTGYVSSEKAAGYLTGAAIGVIPRRDLLANRIITTLKIYEYWASGTAVIATSLEGIREIANDGEHLLFVPSGDSIALSSALISLLSDPVKRERLAAAGAAHVQGFSWEASIHKIVDHALGTGRGSR